MVDPLLRRKATEEQHIAVRTRGDRITLRLIKVGYNMNMVLGYSNFNMLGPLGLAQSYPSSHFVECADGADVAEDESHKTTDETTVSPAGGLEGGPEVATQTTLARFAVVQEETISAAHPIVVEVVNDRNFEIKSSLIYRWGKARKGILNDP